MYLQTTATVFCIPAYYGNKMFQNPANKLILLKSEQHRDRCRRSTTVFSISISCGNCPEYL